jgi:hypothetical protein
MSASEKIALNLILQIVNCGLKIMLYEKYPADGSGWFGFSITKLQISKYQYYVL